MYINKYEFKSELSNTVRDVNAELLYEGYQDVDDRQEAMFDLQHKVAKTMVSRKNYDSDDDYEDAIDEFFGDGENELCFVKRDTIVCSALMNFYAPNGTVKDFDRVAAKHIVGFHSQMLADDDSTTDEGYSDQEGFWFVASNDYMDALVPYDEQDKFYKSLNPNKTLKEHVYHTLSKDELDNTTELLDSVQDDLGTKNKAHPHNYSLALQQLKSVRDKLGL